MASGKIDLTRNNSNLFDGQIVWSSTKNESANTSSVTATLYIQRSALNSTTGTFTGNFTVGSTQKTLNWFGTLPSYEWVEIEETTVTVAHNDAGVGTCSLNAVVYAPSGTSLAGGYVNCSTSVSLDTIPRASVIDSAGDVNLGSACSVTWTPKSADFRYKLNFKLGTWEYTTGAIHPNMTTAYTYTGYTIPLDAAESIPQSKTGKMTVTLYTYSNSGATAQVGSADSETFTVTVPNNSSTRPTVSMDLSPVGSLPAKFAGLYIQGKTKVKAAISATGKYKATISSCRTTVGGKSYGVNESYTSGFLSNYGNNSVYGYATDSRGYTGSTSKNITVIVYNSPTIKVDVCGRCDENGNLADAGTHLKIKATRSYHAVTYDGEQKNFCKIQYRYKAASANAWSNWTTILAANSLDSNTVETGALLSGALSAKVTYLVEVQAIDDIGDHSETIITIPTEEVYWHRAKKALGLGKYAEGENLLDVGWDAHFRGEVRIGASGMTLREYILSVINEGG